MSKEIQEQTTRVAFTPGDVSAAEMDTAADELGFGSRAEFVRAAVREKAAQAETSTEATELYRPEVDRLDEAYRRLLALSEQPTGVRRVSVAEARSQLWSQDVPKEEVADRLLRPLGQQGFISVSNGQITVHRRSEQEHAEATEAASSAFSRLHEAGMDVQMRSVAPKHNELLKYRRAGLDVPFRLTAWVAGEVLWTDV